MEKQQYIETVNHLKKKLDKGVSFEKTMHILYKLQKIPISIKLLEATGIGLKIRELSKAEKSNDIGKTAKLLTMTWKDFVRNQPADDDNDDDDDDADDDELEHQEYRQNGRIKEEEDQDDHHHSQEDSPPHSRQNHTSSSHRSSSSSSSSHHHSKHSKKSSHHHRDREADHQAEVNGHRSSHRITPDSDREEESSPPERSSTSSKHKEKKKHKHHHKEKKSKHHKSSKSSSKISDDSEGEEEEEEEIDSTDEAAAELFGAAISASKSKEQRKAEKKARRKEEKKKEEKRRSGDHQESSNVKRIRIKEPVDPNASPSKRIGSQRELTVENGADLFSQMLSTSGSASKLAAQANGSYTPSGKHSSTSASTSSSQKHASSSSRHQSSSQLASTSSRHPSNSSSSTTSSSSSSSSSAANSQLRLSQQSSNKANQALDMLASMNGIKGSSSSQNSSSSSNSGYLGPDPNYRPAMHRRLDEMIAEGASARARAGPPPQATSASSAQQLHFKSAAAKDSYERANTAGMKLFKGRTAVWSGASRHVTVAKVYPLQELCIRLLMNHLDMIFEVGDLPYYILKPVLEKCTVGQLRRIEYYNPQLCDESDELWNEFVQKEFKQPLKPARFDSWREYYDWQVEARERKLKAITEGISSKARKAVPERKTVTIDVKLPREIRRRQERSTNPFYSSGGSSNRASSSSYSGSSSGGGLGGTAPHSMTAGGMVTLGANKPKTAPLMKKLLQIRKGKGGFKR